MVLTNKEQEEVNILQEQISDLQRKMDKITNKPVVYGYARVSTKGQARDGNSLERQHAELFQAGATEIYTDTFTGKVTTRPELDKLFSVVKAGDTVIVTKLDRIARSVVDGSMLIEKLQRAGVKIHILNMGLIDASPTGRLIEHIMFAFAEFERDMILQRTFEGKQIARQRPGYHEGRPKKFTAEQIRHTIDLLKENSYTHVAKMTGISKSTLVRERSKAKASARSNSEQELILSFFFNTNM